MTQEEMITLCDEETELSEKLAKLDEALNSCVILRDTYNKSLTDRQRLCGKNAISFADDGNWEGAMYELHNAVENGEKPQAGEGSRPLTTNEVIYFGLIVTALCAVWKRQSHKPKVTIKQFVEMTKVIDAERNVVKRIDGGKEQIYHIMDSVPDDYRELRLIRDDMFCYYAPSPFDFSYENLIAVPIKEDD